MSAEDEDVVPGSQGADQQGADQQGADQVEH
jgi:hypothetical protein